MQNQYVPTVHHAQFVQSLLLNYAVKIPEVCQKFQITNPEEGTNIAINVVRYALSQYKVGRELCATTTISALRQDREFLIPIINQLVHDLVIIQTNADAQKVKVSIHETSAVPPDAVKAEVKSELKQMHIQDLIKLRRLVGTSIALTTILENVFVIHETRFAQHSNSGYNNPSFQRMDSMKYVNEAARASVMAQGGMNSFGFHEQAKSGENPYECMEFTTTQLDQIDAKLMEVLQILFPYETDQTGAV